MFLCPEKVYRLYSQNAQRSVVAVSEPHLGNNTPAPSGLQKYICSDEIIRRSSRTEYSRRNTTTCLLWYGRRPGRAEDRGPETVPGCIPYKKNGASGRVSHHGQLRYNNRATYMIERQRGATYMIRFGFTVQ